MLQARTSLLQTLIYNVPSWILLGTDESYQTSMALTYNTRAYEEVVLIVVESEKVQETPVVSGNIALLVNFTVLA